MEISCFAHQSAICAGLCEEGLSLLHVLSVGRPDQEGPFTWLTSWCWLSAGNSTRPEVSLYMASPCDHSFFTMKLDAKGKNIKRDSQPEAISPFTTQPWKLHGVTSATLYYSYQTQQSQSLAKIQWRNTWMMCF